jgi:ABC-type transport system substrate-binding protein
VRVSGSVAAAVIALTVTTALTGCAADPPPAVRGSDTSPPPAVPDVTGGVVQVAVDSLGAGFNPHLASNLSPATTALAEMTLPSVFEQELAPDGSVDYRLNTDLVPTVEQPSPLELVYTIRPDAQWSDGAPIAAEDFTYLWQMMVTMPDTVGAAAYRMIDSVTAGAGGKQVTVKLKAAFPGWKELFRNLLPSHLVRDAPGGFNGAMREQIPASGAGFRVKRIDIARDEVSLERNDRYWMQPAGVSEIVVRKGGGDPQLANSVRTGDVQVVTVHGGRSLQAQLASIYQVRTVEQPASRLLALTLNSRSPLLSDVAVRQALLGALDVDLLTTVGSGGGSVRPARAQLLAPSDPGYKPTMPARADATTAKAKLERTLAAAGYSLQNAPIPPTVTAPPTPAAPSATVSAAPSASAPSPSVPSPGAPSGSGVSGSQSSEAEPTHTTLPVPPAPVPGEKVPQYVRNGTPMFLRIGVPSDDQAAFAVASNATDQLRAMGVFASVVVLEPKVLSSTALLSSQVDAVVTWSGLAPPPVERLAAREYCPPAVPGTPPPTTPEAAGAVVGENLSGACSADLAAAAARGVSGQDIDQTDIDDALWQQATVLPILQDVTLVAVAPTVTGVQLPGTPASGVFTEVERWERSS